MRTEGVVVSVYRQREAFALVFFCCCGAPSVTDVMRASERALRVFVWRACVGLLTILRSKADVFMTHLSVSVNLFM